MDQPENQKNICTEKHVWVQAHQGLWPLLRWQPRTHGKYWAACVINRQGHFIDFYHVVYSQVVFATPGMLHAGQSLQIFKKWAGNEKNMVRCTGGRRNKWKRRQESHQLVLPFQVIMPGYCVQGTIGHKILNGQRKLEMEGRATVRWFSFSIWISPNSFAPIWVRLVTHFV